MSTANAPRNTYYIVIPRQPPNTGASIRPLARLLQLEEDRVREILLTPTYEVVSRFARKPNAQGLQNQLTALGVTNLLVSDQDIRGHMILSVATANMGAGGIAFRDFDDKPLFCPFDDIVGVLMMDVGTNLGTTTTLVDIHRTSTNITLRLDANLFNFEAMMNRTGAKLSDFLAHLEEKCRVQVDRRFAEHREQLIRVARDFATRPIDLAPPHNRLEAPYKRDDSVSANMYSFVRSVATRVP